MVSALKANKTTDEKEVFNKHFHISFNLCLGSELTGFNVLL